MFDSSKKKKHSVREEEQDAGQHVTNDLGDVTPEQTSQQQQQGNSNLDNQNNVVSMEQQDQAKGVQGGKDEKPGVPSQDSPTAQDMEGTIADPVSFSNPAFDPSIDAAKVNLKGADKDKDSSELLHVFKPGHFYKKGDTVRYHGIMFKALQDHHGDIAPSIWEATGEEDTSSQSPSGTPVNSKSDADKEQDKKDSSK